MSSPDEIRLAALELRCHIGVPDAERAQPQLLQADVVIHSAVRFEAMADEIASTIDYAAVAIRLQEIAAERPRQLIETLAADLAACILEEFRAPGVEITIRKRILPCTDHVAVRLTRLARTNA